MAETLIYSIAVCPFAQRTRLLLTLKNVEFELTEIDITQPRPSWFLNLNPSGQVPVIVHNQNVLYESSVINEYLEETFPLPAVFPKNSYQKALSRILIERVNSQFVPTMYALLMNQEATLLNSLTEQALESWRWLNQFLEKHSSNPKWVFDDFGMADLSIAPFFQRYCLNEYYRGFRLPHHQDYYRVRRWRDAVLSHALVIETGLSDDDYIKLYEDYALGFGNGKIPPGREHSSFDLGRPLHERAMPPTHAKIDPLTSHLMAP